MARKGAQDNQRIQIDENLRRIYQQTLDERVPDRLLSLLDQLRAKAASGDPEAGAAAVSERDDKGA
ncbi:MAG: NepR family anti-sigma factor [Gemmobacter sp.]